MSTYNLDITDDAKADMTYYKAFERKLIVDDVRIQLAEQPDVETNSKKRLRDNPIATWELRTGKFRIFYEINFEALEVSIISVGHKEHNVLYIRGRVVKL